MKDSDYREIALQKDTLIKMRVVLGDECPAEVMEIIKLMDGLQAKAITNGVEPGVVHPSIDLNIEKMEDTVHQIEFKSFGMFMGAKVRDSLRMAYKAGRNSVFEEINDVIRKEKE